LTGLAEGVLDGVFGGVEVDGDFFGVSFDVGREDGDDEAAPGGDGVLFYGGR
jgi:hypothetical protein